jgi:hypothetical protein
MLQFCGLLLRGFSTYRGTCLTGQKIGVRNEPTRAVGPFGLGHLPEALL